MVSMDEGTIKTPIPKCRDYWCFCLGRWCSNFVGVKLLHNMVYNTTQHIIVPIRSIHLEPGEQKPRTTSIPARLAVPRNTVGEILNGTGTGNTNLQIRYRSSPSRQQQCFRPEPTVPPQRDPPESKATTASVNNHNLKQITVTRRQNRCWRFTLFWIQILSRRFKPRFNIFFDKMKNIFNQCLRTGSGGSIINLFPDPDPYYFFSKTWRHFRKVVMAAEEGENR